MINSQIIEIKIKDVQIFNYLDNYKDTFYKL